MQIKSIVRDHVMLEESGELVEDKIFFIVEARNPNGELANTENGMNYWVKEKDFPTLDKLYYNEINIYKLSQTDLIQDYKEATYIIDNF